MPAVVRALGLLQELLPLLDLTHQLRQRLNTPTRAATGLTLERGVILCIIALNGGPAPISDIANALSGTSHTVSAVVTRLEKEGLVARDRGAFDDRRRVSVRITPAGRKRLAASRQVVTDILNGLPLKSGGSETRRLSDAIDVLRALLPD